MFLGHHVGARPLLSEAFFRASFHTRRTLNALKVINLPGASVSIDGNGVGGALSLAKAAEDTSINLITNFSAGRRIIFAWGRGIGMRGRFRKEGF